MDTPDLYRRRKALKICVACGTRGADPLITLCAPCRELARQNKAHWTATFPEKSQAAAARFRETHALTTGPNLVACCGTWWNIDRIPLTVSCCGTTYFLEEPL